MLSPTDRREHASTTRTSSTRHQGCAAAKKAGERGTSRALTALLIAVTFIQAGCAHGGANYRPLIDTQGADLSRLERDLSECQAYARQVAGAADQAAAGALIGAALGAVLAAAAGSRYDRGASARVGAVSGIVGGAAQGETDQRSVVRNCMSGRGYRVLQ